MRSVRTARRVIFFLLAVATALGCASPPVAVRPKPTPEQLFFAVELTQDGHRLGAPQLLGFEGRQVTAERRAPGAQEADYRLVLRPHESGAGYQVVLELVLPSGKSEGSVALLHGEERSVKLGDQTELKLLLMRVDSPEFRALMQLAPERGRGTI